jgi:hypothetical protein
MVNADKFDHTREFIDWPNVRTDIGSPNTKRHTVRAPALRKEGYPNYRS